MAKKLMQFGLDGKVSHRREVVDLFGNLDIMVKNEDEVITFMVVKESDFLYIIAPTVDRRIDIPPVEGAEISQLKLTYADGFEAKCVAIKVNDSMILVALSPAEFVTTC